MNMFGGMTARGQRPEYIDSVLGDRVFDGDDGYEELLESLRENEREIERRIRRIDENKAAWRRMTMR